MTKSIKLTIYRYGEDQYSFRNPEKHMSTSVEIVIPYKDRNAVKDLIETHGLKAFLKKTYVQEIWKKEAEAFISYIMKEAENQGGDK